MKFGIYCEMQADPSKDHKELMWDLMTLIESADGLGFDSFNLIEHHLYPEFGISANPLAMFTAAAQRTDHIRFRTVCHIVPFHHPLILAGEIAAADILTRGRLECGFGRGHGWLYPPSGLPMQESKGRYQEGLEIIQLAFTKESFSYDGHFYQIKDAHVVPKPLQKPYPPIYLRCLVPQ